MDKCIYRYYIFVGILLSFQMGIFPFSILYFIIFKQTPKSI